MHSVLQYIHLPNHHRLVQNSASVKLFVPFSSINVSQRKKYAKQIYLQLRHFLEVSYSFYKVKTEIQYFWFLSNSPTEKICSDTDLISFWFFIQPGVSTLRQRQRHQLGKTRSLKTSQRSFSWPAAGWQECSSSPFLWVGLHIDRLNGRGCRFYVLKKIL